jgi:hypothetical protein
MNSCSIDATPGTAKKLQALPEKRKYFLEGFQVGDCMTFPGNPGAFHQVCLLESLHVV